MNTSAPFPLPDELRLPSGETWTGTRARVYWLLRLTAERRHRHAMETVPPTVGPLGWVPIHTLRATWSGGAQGDRRARDLREQGVAVDHARWSVLGGPKDSAATLYRITRDELLAFNPEPPGLEAERRHPAATLPAAPPATHPLLTDLYALRFWTVEGQHPGADAGATLCVEPGTPHALAAPADIRELIAAGDLTPEQASARYRELLLAAYRAGAFRSVSGHRHLVLYTLAVDGRWSPLPTLTAALCGLRATHQGTWMRRSA